MKKLIVLVLIIATIACQQNTSKVEQATISGKYSKEDSALVNTAKMFFKIIPEQANQSENQVTDAKVKLGQVLFYDTRLSKTGNNSCNSCHNLSTYGVDNVSTSKGDAGQTGERNSPTVFNAALHNMQFWDGRAATIEEQAGMPILNPVEMAIPHKGFLVTKLHKDTVYHKLFTSAFPGESEPVSFANLKNAIGAFERTLLTPSRFDKFMGGDLTALNPDEKAGLKTFIDSGCVACHNGVGIGGGSLQQFGIYTDYRTLTHSLLNDEGRYKVTGDKADKNVFKVPGLRNVEKTYPYFHDGSIVNLDSSIMIMAKTQLNKTFTGDEVKNIVAFLKTLTGDVREEAKKIPDELKGIK